MKKISIISTLVFLVSFFATAQNDIQFSQQMFSRINQNPATTGFSNYANAYLLARQQWVGIEGAPSTQMINFQSYMAKIRSGVGISLSNDSFGKKNTMNAKVAYAYHLAVGEQKYFSFGLNAGVLYGLYKGLNINVNEIDPYAEGQMMNESKVLADFDFGMAYATRKFAIGLSATHISSYIYEQDGFSIPMHLYFYTEYHHLIKDHNVTLTPRIQVMAPMKVTEDPTYLQAEIGLSANFKNVFWVGASYRWKDAIIAMAGINITKDFRLGYSYDFSVGGGASGYNKGSHEVMLNYRILMAEPNRRASKTPLFFD